MQKFKCTFRHFNCPSQLTMKREMVKYALLNKTKRESNSYDLGITQYNKTKLKAKSARSAYLQEYHE